MIRLAPAQRQGRGAGRPGSRRRRGMTLFEVMVAIAIVIVLASVGWSSLDGAVEMNEVLARNDSTVRTARVALGRLRRELQLAYLTPNKGVANGLPTYQTVFVGEDANPDTAWWATLGHQRLYRNSRECDQAEVTVWAERAPRDVGKGDVLYHRESERIDELPAEGGRVWPLAYNVDTFNLRYLDGRIDEWKDEWDTRSVNTPGILPRAVQIGLVLLAPDPDDDKRTVEVPFVTTVMLEYADPVQSIVNPLNSNLNPLNNGRNVGTVR